ncbi:hypothetical protein BGX34_006601 [Mortierella sp. NVP85]|nr:hypothetical protein BGX34_006601 [Mortierella sp. NVP85]
MDPDSQFGHWARQNEKSTKHFFQGVHQDLVSSPYIYNPPFGKKKSTNTTQNLLPWREICAEVIIIGENNQHQLDLDELETQLQLHRERPLKIGSFSAGSNLTGVLNDTIAIAELLHKYDAFAFFGYAYIAYGLQGWSLLSPHKMVGGPGCSGVLAARLEIFSWADHNSSTAINEIIPSCPAGGTVDFVSKDRYKYVKSMLSREEAGTPNILATIRTGLVLRLQEIMDPTAILAEEYRLATSIYERLARHGCIEILGTPTLNRVTVFSAMVTIPVLSTIQRPMQIHYSLLSMMMNDFFGIEMRGGCMCAGPYGSKLLGFGPEKVAAFWNLLVGDDDSNSCSNSFVNKKEKRGSE